MLLRAADMDVSIAVQSTGARFSSASIARVVESMERMSDSTVPLHQGEQTTVSRCSIWCMQARSAITSFLKWDPWSDTQTSAEVKTPSHRARTSATCSEMADKEGLSQQ